MKASLNLLLLFFPIFIFAQTSKVNDDMSFFDYSYDKAIIKQNKIAKVEIDSYSGNKISSRFSFLFNENGCLTQEVIKNTAGQKVNEYNFTCNAHGDLLSIKNVEYDLNKTYVTNYYRSYEGSKLVKDSSSLLPITNYYFYDSAGRRFKTSSRSNFGSITLKTISNIYNSSGKITEVIEKEQASETDTTSHILSHRAIFYNNFGKPSREEELVNHRYNTDLMINEGSIRYTYDDKGNLTQAIRSNAASYYYTYNERGLITSKKMSLVMDSKQTVSDDRFSYEFRK